MNLTVTGLQVRYGRQPALAGLCLHATGGEVLGVLGANGSGKSSLLRALAGHQPHEGSIVWQGTQPVIGFLPQDNAVRSGLTGFEVALLGRLRSLAVKVGDRDLHAAQDALAEIGISHLSPRPVGQLSGGQRQLVFLAQVLAADPHVLLLDEPTSALDIAHQLHVLSLVRRITRSRGLTTIVVLHDINAAARFCDRVMLLHQGAALAMGHPREVMRADLLRIAYGVDVRLHVDEDGIPFVVPLRSVAAAR